MSEMTPHGAEEAGAEEEQEMEGNSEAEDEMFNEREEVVACLPIRDRDISEKQQKEQEENTYTK